MAGDCCCHNMIYHKYNQHSGTSGKGLRQMAVSVVNVVKSKGVVSYLEVGDQLVRQLLASKGKGTIPDCCSQQRSAYYVHSNNRWLLR